MKKLNTSSPGWKSLQFDPSSIISPLQSRPGINGNREYVLYQALIRFQLDLSKRSISERILLPYPFAITISMGLIDEA